MPERPVRDVAWAAVGVGVASGLISMATRAPAITAAGRAYVATKNVAYWSLWALLMPLAVRAADAIRARRWPGPVAVAVHALTGAAFALAHVTAMHLADVVLAATFLDPRVVLPTLAARIAATPRLVWEWELTMYGAVAALAYAGALGTELRTRAVAQARLEAGLAEARLLSLQRQLQPHFLFNSLHAVTSLIRRDPDAAEETVDRLGRLLRTTFRSGPAAEVPLANELEMLRDYLAIEQVQMRERLAVTFEIAPETAEAAVPVLLVQPIVENAIRHGLQPRARGGRIRIAASRHEDRLVIVVEDDGMGLAEAAGRDAGVGLARTAARQAGVGLARTAAREAGVGLARTAAREAGVGLANTRDRLAQLYGDRQSLAVTDAPGGGVRVEVTLPWRQAAAA